MVNIKRLIRYEIDKRKERKQYGSVHILASNSSVWSVPQSLCNIAYGGGLAQRDGERIRVKRLHVRIQLYRNQDPSITVRCVIFSIKKDATPSVSELFNGGGGILMLDFRNEEFLHEYDVIRDFKMTVSDTVHSTYKDIFIKLNHLIHYNGINANDVGQGGIYITLTTDSSTFPYAQFNFAARLIYQDD